MVRFLVVLAPLVLILLSCAATNTRKISKIDQWNFLHFGENLALMSAPIAEHGKLFGRGGVMNISILCEYGVSSIANDCMTSFMFALPPRNFGTFHNKFEPIPTDVFFVKEGKRDRLQITLYPIRTNTWMISPTHVDSFLSVVEDSNEVAVFFKWRILRASQETDHEAIFSFNLNKTTTSLDSLKAQVLENPTSNESEPITPTKSVAEILENYI